MSLAWELSVIKSYAVNRATNRTGHFSFTITIFIIGAKRYIFPILLILTLSIAEEVSSLTAKNSWLVNLSQTLAVLIVINLFLTKQISNNIQLKLARLLLLPLALLFFMGWMDDISLFLEKFRYKNKRVICKII